MLRDKKMSLGVASGRAVLNSEPRMLAAAKASIAPQTAAADEPFVAERVGECWCLTGGDGPISRREWHDFLHSVRGEAASKVLLLASTGDMAPNALQRAQLYQLASECELRVAWLTNSTYSRGAIRALGGGGRLQIAAFDVGQVPEALSFLGLQTPTTAEASMLTVLLDQRA